MQRCMRLQRCQDTGQTSMGQWNNHQVACHLICMHRPMGSSVNGTFLLQLSDLCMMALIAACLENDLAFEAFDIAVL